MLMLAGITSNGGEAFIFVSNYDVIQSNVIKYGSRVLYAMGFNVIDADFPVLDAVGETRFFGLFLGTNK
jgi:hypothetical protein